MSHNDSSSPDLLGHARLVDRAPWVDLLEARFGIPPEVFEPFAFFRVNKKNLHIAPRDLRPPTHPRPDVLGMHLLRTNMHYPKLTTAAAMAFVAHATHNIVPVDEAGADAFLSRVEHPLCAERAARCTSRGYVLAQYREMTLGVGFYQPSEHEGGTLRSMFPKAWSVNEATSVFHS